MATNNTTFWNLINSNKISIPIIQRDYAQGREEESEKREKFLNAIFKYLTNSEKLHLDFVYGRVKDNTFFPIDGQQRLTTLFLLHWYFAFKEKVSNEEKSKLSQFVYDTRISSREFCQSLIREEIVIPLSTGDDTFIKTIKNQPWYRDKWDTDPTVKAMLVMIQDIHNKFNSINSSSVFAQLINEDSISFELLDLGKKGFELTDELYIKMNARGKQLTPFENFKANFIQLIDKHFKNKKLEHPIKGEISYSGYFSYKIEKEWTDLFWAYRGDKKTTDEGFSNYFEFLTQILYFKKHKDANADDFKNNFTQYEDVFSNEQNLLFLFTSLDKLYDIFCLNGGAKKENINNFFASIENITTFFWNTTRENSLFERIVSNTKNEDARNKILLFSIIYYLIKHNLSSSDNQLVNYVRLIRNLMQATRQRNETKYNTNIRINFFGSYWILFEQLASVDVYKAIQDPTLNNKSSRISDASLNNEIEKAKILQSNIPNISSALRDLEEFDEFGGLIHQLKPTLNQPKLQYYSQAVKEIWNISVSDTLRIQTLIACSFDGLFIKDTKMGETYYFGKDGNWSVILTNEEEEISKSILLFLDTYINIKNPETDNKLQAIVDEWLATNNADRSYKYYFLKYPEFTSKLNYFVWPNDCEIRMLGTEGSNPLVAYHISPFVLTVCQRIDNKNICDENQCYLQYSGNSPIILKNGVTMSCTLEGWLMPVNSIITSNIISKYSLELINDFYLLKDNDKKDRIEIAIDFINSLFN
ncbi:GmrSD restriction endonuclease domain-containing protein [Flavobacterium sp.]|uniref:GmrSD restriction endonuclease domain-containing protein n=1 Tax=Flavobacterium sp. TaxID=239 RepID=UPI003B9A3DE0